MKNLLIILSITFGNISFAQSDTATEARRTDLKHLIEINRDSSSTTFNNPEGLRLSGMTATQALAVIPAFLETNDPVAKQVCWSMIGRAILHSQNIPSERRSLVELLCRFYLHSDFDIQTVDNVLFQLHADDFNDVSKKYIASLFSPLPKYDNGIIAKLAAMAQIRELIPSMWIIAKKDINNIQRKDVEVLSALARLGDEEANALLCQYYLSERSKGDKNGDILRYVLQSEHLAFTLSQSSLDCLLNDFNTIDISLQQNGNDYFWWPSAHLARQIVQMVKDYPYDREYVRPAQLKEWLATNPHPIIKEK
jgi:hypothetical protein